MIYGSFLNYSLTLQMKGGFMSTISDIRAELKMSQESFAEFCDISRVSVARYEAGAQMSRKNAKKIARACGISIDHLLNGTFTESYTVYPTEKHETGLSPEEKELIEIYRSMSLFGRERALETLLELQIVYPEPKPDSGD